MKNTISLLSLLVAWTTAVIGITAYICDRLCMNDGTCCDRLMEVRDDNARLKRNMVPERQFETMASGYVHEIEMRKNAVTKTMKKMKSVPQELKPVLDELIEVKGPTSSGRCSLYEKTGGNYRRAIGETIVVFEQTDDGIWRKIVEKKPNTDGTIVFPIYLTNLYRFVRTKTGGQDRILGTKYGYEVAQGRCYYEITETESGNVSLNESPENGKRTNG